MISKEILQKVQLLEIRTKGIVNTIFGGEYQSAFKGRGMEFSEVRAYTFGDDVRQIDWNVTARSNEPYIKVFEEEREQTLMLCVDISTSGLFGSHRQTKMELATELSAVLAFSAIKNGDKVGMVLFSDRIEKVIPPKKGKNHVLRLIREIFATKPSGKKTDIQSALKYLGKLVSRRAIIVLLSDFEDQNYEKQLKTINRKHDLVNIVIRDRLEDTLPELGLLRLQDPETGQMTVVDTSSNTVRKAYQIERKKQREMLLTFFRKHQMDHVELYTNESYVKSLSGFFQRRIAHN
ncbi:MAG: DUF58 domain-containing protein [Bacteroidetes bacterium]|nr:DUF58 domain-containing protein [Bacteroidota bacterium]PTM08046.1 MAG: DUF58 domain-containing protein [Bacteroidota bacterium]PTM20820.1 MAG: DUF58 domain-containing protein [Bacteroidota bacterium]